MPAALAQALAVSKNASVDGLSDIGSESPDACPCLDRAAASEIEDRLMEQYDTKASMTFYTTVMGGGGDDIHYGIFNTGKEDLRQSSENTVRFMAKLAKEVVKLGSSDTQIRVLDLGSGKGGSARFLAKKYGCHVTCFNLGKNQNEFNIRRVREQDLGHLISCIPGSFNRPLPAEWTDMFDLVWSQEALCHAVDQEAVLYEIQRVLKPGGALVFSDVMQGDMGGDISSFTSVNVTARMCTPSMYKAAIKSSGMKLRKHEDLTRHLMLYYRRMQRAVVDSRMPLMMAGVSASRLDAYVEDLSNRFDAVEQRALAWGAFVAVNLYSSDALLAGSLPESLRASSGSLELLVQEQYDTDASMMFYKTVMGGGDDGVHYGMFKTGQECLRDSSHNTVQHLAELACRSSALQQGKGEQMRVLDLGSGKGGAARYLALTYGCHVTCFNLGKNENAYNMERARQDGISHLIDCHIGSFNDPLPAEWTASFDLVWSLEALCHAVDESAVISEIQRVLKPGGSAVFTAVMESKDGAARKGSPTAGKKTASPSLYMDAVSNSGMRLAYFQDCTPHLHQYFKLMLESMGTHDEEMMAAGVPRARIEGYKTDLLHRLEMVAQGDFVWGTFVAKKPAISKVLIVGAGPLGSFAALRLSGCGVADVTVKMLPDTDERIEEMLTLCGCCIVRCWEDLMDMNFNIVLLAVKTHWLPQIAYDMSNYGVTWDNLALVYNGYSSIPDNLKGPRTCSVVVPQSFSFDKDALPAWDVKHGNASNPWCFPTGQCSKVITAQLRQAGVLASISTTFHYDAFFKFCVNTSANLLSVLTSRNCRSMVEDKDCNALMRAILHEAFDVMGAEPMYAALVPMNREPFIANVIEGPQGSVLSYQEHHPSAHAHYNQRKLLETKALNGFVARLAQTLNMSAPVNEYVARAAHAMATAHIRGVPREQWTLSVELAACQRLIEHFGMGNSVWGHASVRDPSEPRNMMIQAFGSTFGQAHASDIHSIPAHPKRLTPQQLQDFNETAVVLHGAVYEAREDVGCVLHTHSPYATALANSSTPFRADIMQDAMQFDGRVAYHDFFGVADEIEEMERVRADVGGVDVVFMRNHGVIVVGPDVPTAFSRLWYLERACQVQLLSEPHGVVVPSREAVAQTRRWYAKDGAASALTEWKAHKKDLLRLSGQFARPAFYE